MGAEKYVEKEQKCSRICWDRVEELEMILPNLVKGV